VMVNVLGKFPPLGSNQLLGPEEIRAAINRPLQPSAYIGCQFRLGCDVARAGIDQTIVSRRQGLKGDYPLIDIPDQNQNNIAGNLMNLKNTHRADVEFVDGTGGFGAGVCDQLLALGGCPMEIHFSSDAIDKGQFANRRSEMWYQMAQWVKRGGSIPNDPKLHRELAAPTFDFDNKGRIRLEPKEMMKKRLGYSPDRADALALTFALPELAHGTADTEAAQTQPSQKDRYRRVAPPTHRMDVKPKHDWDPLDTNRWKR